MPATPSGNFQAATLSLNVLVEREIKGRESQILTVPLLKSQYAQVAFDWRGIDLDVTIRGPIESENKPASFHVRGSGSLPVALIANADGDYSLVVRPVENARITGRYGVVLAAARPPASIDQKRVEALNLIAEAESERSTDAATDKLRHALALWGELGDEPGTRKTLQMLGLKHLPSSQASVTDNAAGLTTADEYYQRSIAVAQQGDPLEFAYTLLEIGTDYENFASPKKALPYYKRALQIFRDSEQQQQALRDTRRRRGEATALFAIGLAEAKIGHMREALQWYEPALVINRAENDRLEEARTLNGIGGVYGVLADQDLALSFYQQAAPIWKELNDGYREALTIKNIGVVYDDWGDLQTAKDKYLESLSLLKLQLTTKDSESCKTALQSDDVRICRSIANTLDNVGELYSSLGESQLALNTLHDALSIRENLKQPQGIGATWSRIAYAHLLQNEPTEALKDCERALPFSKKAEDLRKVGSILTFFGMSKAALNQPDEALEYYRQALTLQETTGELRGKGITLDQMGRAYALKKDLARARESYEGALAIWRQIKDQEWEPRSIYNLARAEQEQGDLASALLQIEKAIQIVESRRGTLNNLQLRTSYFANKEDIYKLDIDLKMQMAKRTNDASYAASALETSDKTRARTLVDTLSVANLGRSLANSSNSQLDPRLVELEARRRVLLGQMNAKSQSQIKLLGGKHTSEQSEAIDKEIDDLTNKYDAVVHQVTEISPHYAALTRPKPLTAAEIQQQLDDNTLLLEYSLGDTRSYAWVVSSDEIKSVELPARREVEALARRVSNAITAPNRKEKNETVLQEQTRLTKAEKEYAQAAAALSEMILEPVASLLGQKRLVVVADGALQQLSFTGLPAPASVTAIDSRPNPAASTVAASGPQPLIVEHEIITLPSASLLALQRRELANRTPARFAIAVLADPVFDQQDARVAELKGRGSQPQKDQAKTAQSPPPLANKSVPGSSAAAPATNDQSPLVSALRDIGSDSEGKLHRLMFSLQEAKAILRAAPANQSFSALGFKASRQTAASAELANYRIIHFATHGVMDLEHPQWSGIVLSMVDEKGQPVDGYLRLNEIYNLNLPAELVVLSACQTGVGKQIKGEGLIALTRGFMYAGAKNVVASLWKVDDSATSALMAEFYRQMFTNQLKPAAALRAAQREIARQKRWQSPYFWAGFFLQGDWN